MDDNDVIVFDCSTTSESSMIDYGSITIDLSDVGAAQPTYTVNGLDDLILTVDNTGIDGITDWLQEREIIEQHKEEKSIRETHPAVQYAYEQYQILLNLAREEPQDPTETA